ncbi:MAG: hypothetical protein RJB66_2664 [Pseudomonadota bacterium]|jgi:hypothetical protein
MSAPKLFEFMDSFSSFDVTEYRQGKIIYSDPEKTVLHSSQWAEGQILELATRGPFNTFLNSNNRNFLEELLVALKVKSDPEGFLANPLLALYEEKPKSVNLTFSLAKEKDLILNKLEPFFAAAESATISDHMRIAFEELFMNAVYDAPQEAIKMGLEKSTKTSEIIAAYDQHKATITCIDAYGSLHIPKIIQRMRDIELSGTKNIINLGDKPGGAGIGCSLLHRYSTGITIAVKKGEATLVSCTFPLRTSYKQFCAIGKNLQFLNIPPTGGRNGK